jgi:hypothetical protein
MTKRKSTGKRLRFAVFARDNFTCRYCGKQSDSVELQVDHIIPVSKGGSNDESNLVTSCVPCNQGKSDILLEQAAPNETDRLRLAQELHEQKQAAKRAKQILKARKSRYQDLVNFLCESTGTESFNAQTAKILFRYVEQFGEDIVYPWIEKAAERTRTDIALGRYVSGIRRSVLAEQEDA